MGNRKFGNWKDSNNCHVKLIPYWKEYSENFSVSSIKGIYLELVKFALWNWRHGRKTLIEVDGRDCIKYFKSKINRRDVLKSSKKRVYHFISSYYTHLKDFLEVFEKREFNNPIPRTLIKFEGKTSVLDDLEQEFELISMKDIERIVKQFYFARSSMYYIFICLIIYGGPRVRELAQVKIENISLKNRWYLTEVKSQKSNKRIGIYFFPGFFVSELQDYINLLEIEHPETKFLFPSSNKTKGFISPRTIESNLKQVKEQLGIRALTHPHIFRDFLNSRREERGATQIQRKFLLNQKNPDVNINSYLKKYKNREILRNYYDKFNPFTESLKPNVRLM